MAHSLIFVRTTLGWEDVGLIRDYLREMEEALRDVAGFQGGGAWKGVENPQDRMVLFSYESAEAAGRGLVAVGEMPTLVERLSEEATSPDVRMLNIEQESGAFERVLPVDALVSASVRTAEPGYGPEMVSDYEDVFGGLSMVSGYAGSLIGTNVKMSDEVVGLVAWSHAAAFDSSLPTDLPYEIVLYEPLGEA